jgi:pimeloyl-[acyl-carrier protein] synthase
MRASPEISASGIARFANLYRGWQQVAPESDGWRVEDFDPRCQAFIEDPYPFYARLRAQDPIHYNRALGVWLVTRYDDVSLMLTDGRLGKQPTDGAKLAPEWAELTDLPRDLASVDPPDHTRLRSLVAKAFSHSAIEQLRPCVRKIASDLIDRALQEGGMDVVANLASPLPGMVMSAILGVPVADFELLRGWTAALVRGADVTQGVEARAAGIAANLALADYFQRLINERKLQHREDIISQLIAADESGDRLSTGEVISTCILLLFAGYETSVNLIAVGTLNLLRHPGEFAVLKKNPQLIANAVEELIRYESPVQRVGYYPRQSVVWRGKRIRKDQLVLLVIGAANRDPSLFANPDRLDVTRRPNPHLAFSRGIHFCIGAQLARLEAQVSFELLLRVTRRIELVDRNPQWATNTAQRRLLALPVHLNH